jgi:predicted PurR-regulated permease PerM
LNPTPAPATSDSTQDAPPEVPPGRRLRVAPVLTAAVLTVLLLWLFGAAAEVFLLLFLGILLSLYLGAVTDFFTRRLRLPRGLAFVLAAVVSLAGIVGLFWLLVPPVIQQTRQLVGVLPNYLTAWEARIQEFAARFPALQDVVRPGDHQLVEAVYGQVTSFFDGALPKLAAVLHVGINVFSVGVMAIYLALHPGVYREWLIALFPPVHRDLVRDVLGDLGSQLRSWIVGQLFAMFTLAFLTAIGLYLLKVPYWLTFGIFTGAVAIVPFFGTLVSTMLPALFVLGGPGIWGFGPGGHALLVALLGVVIHALESNIVIPLIIANRVHLPPVLTIMSVLVVGKLMGPTGLLVAVPTLVVLMVVVRRILVNRIYEGQGFRKATRDRVLLLRVPAPEGGVTVADGVEIDPIDEPAGGGEIRVERKIA